MDCSFIAKSGKKTFGVDQFYNGSHNRVERGLEVSLVAVVDVEIEFIFRDAKQFTGLSDCQARDVKKLDFHFNASFTALNIAKLDAHRQQLSRTTLCLFNGQCQATLPQ